MPRDAELSRHNLVFGGVARTHDHDAVMRISGEAPGSGTNLCNGESQAFKRYTATSDHDGHSTCHRRMPILVRSTVLFCSSAGGTHHNSFGDFSHRRVTPQRDQ
jgi:hypothetical protein